MKKLYEAPHIIRRIQLETEDVVCVSSGQFDENLDNLGDDIFG